MSWRAEVWNLPSATTHEVVIKSVPVSAVSWTNGIGINGNAVMTLPSGFDRIDEIIDGPNDVQTLVRLYWDSDLAFAFFPDDRGEEYGEKSGRFVDIGGDGIRSVMSWEIAYPFDYPALPYKTENHIYGGDGNAGSFKNGSFDDWNLNGDAELGGTDGWSNTPQDSIFDAPDVELIVQTTDVRTGTYAFEVDPGASHSGLQAVVPIVGGSTVSFQAYLKDPNNNGDRYTMYIKMGEGSSFSVGAKVWSGYLVVELDAAAYLAGASDGTWQSLDGTVTFGTGVTETTVILQYDEHGAGSSGLFRVDDVDVTGPGVGLDPWIPLGVYTTFELDAAVKLDGDNSLKFQTGVSSIADGSGIRQHVTGLTIGKTYTWSGYLRHDGGGNETFSMVAKRTSGGWLAWTVNVIPTGTAWTYVAVAFTAETEEIWLDWRYGSAGASPVIRFDDSGIAEGLPRQTIGTIYQDMMDDGAVDHIAEVSPGSPRNVLGFLKYDGFDGTNDSDGNAWMAQAADGKLSLTIPMGQNYSQMGGQAAGLGYETDVVWNSVASKWELVVYNDGGMGTDYTGLASPSVVVGQSIVSGNIAKRVAPANRALGVGDEGVWSEATTVASETALSRREAFVADQQSLDVATVATRAESTLQSFERTTTGIKLTFTEQSPVLPVRDYVYGDLVRLHLPSYGVDGWFRVDQYTCNWEPGGASLFTTDFGAEVVTVGASTAVAVKKILDAFIPLDTGVSDSSGDNGFEPFTGPIEPTFLVASVDARASLRAVADFICDGVDDQEEIQFALDKASGFDEWAKVVMSEGRFYMGTDNAYVEINVPANVGLLGSGRGVTELLYMQSHNFDFSIRYGFQSEVGNFIIKEEPGGG